MTDVIEFRNVSKSYHNHAVIKNFNLKIQADSFSVILGAPGSGKSVLLRILTGLEKPNIGEIYLRGVPAESLSPGERNIGYIPQSFALYPHYKIYDNIAYPLALSGASKKEIDQVVQRTAEMLRITKLLNKTPDQLSGGEKQRVAIARGIAKQTDIFVFDDPLTGLDFKLREQLFDDLKNLQDTLKATFVYISSDALEALILARQIGILYDGTCVESGDLVSVYNTPSNSHTMEMLGFPKSNVVPGKLMKKDGKDFCQTDIFSFPVRLDQPATDTVSVGFRPQNVILNAPAGQALLSASAKILLKEDLGGELVVHLSIGDHKITSVVRQDHLGDLGEESTKIGLDPSNALVFESTSGRRIGQGA